MTNTFDIMLTKALGDFFPALDPNRGLFVTFSYDDDRKDNDMIDYL